MNERVDACSGLCPGEDMFRQKKNSLTSAWNKGLLEPMEYANGVKALEDEYFLFRGQLYNDGYWTCLFCGKIRDPDLGARRALGYCVTCGRAFKAYRKFPDPRLPLECEDCENA